MPFASLIQRLYALGFNVICRFDLNRKTFEVTAQRVAASFGSLEHLRVEGRHSPGFAPLSGFWRTADGWIRLHANYPHHEQALMRALKARSEERRVGREGRYRRWRHPEDKQRD